MNINISINASLSKVWDTIVNHAIIRQYFFGSESDTNLKGSWTSYRGSGSGNIYKSKGSFLRFEKEALIEFNYWNSLSGLDDLSPLAGLDIQEAYDNAWIVRILSGLTKQKQFPYPLFQT